MVNYLSTMQDDIGGRYYMQVGQLHVPGALLRGVICSHCIEGRVRHRAGLDDVKRK
jgi:hypothetical protein